MLGCSRTGRQSAEADAADRERPRPLGMHALDVQTEWDRMPKAVRLLAEAGLFWLLYATYES